MRYIKDWLNGHIQRVGISDIKSSWRPETVSIPELNTGSNPIQNVIISGLDNDAECTLIKFPEDKKVR